MPTHRTKAVEVEAFQWTGHPIGYDDPKWLSDALHKGGAHLHQNLYRLCVSFLLPIYPGDWLIRFHDGHIEKRTPEEFAKEFDETPYEEWGDDRLQRIADVERADYYGYGVDDDGKDA